MLPMKIYPYTNAWAILHFYLADENLGLSLMDYSSRGGSLFFGHTSYFFESDQDEIKRLGTWQSYCVVYTSKAIYDVSLLLTTENC